ncbi:DUF1576 domain-containing protein [Marispirochaeta aestuarii]|uniref:DUF1576 domain-containing protein n=1 Tax=Marispirochaeta aestuarii TaxID=1963862 RepID=UPI0029C8F782|nr:DUF1576 domain-containing protein [Marispirochaeta aestuarii]
MLEREEKRLYGLMYILLAGFFLAGLFIQGPASVGAGLVKIQVHPARLLNDFTLVGGEGAALVNAAVIAALGLLLVRINRVRLSGPTLSAVFTIFGFGLFGKTVFNVLPIVIGVVISARIAGKSFREYILMALFGTTLGPLVTSLGFETGLPLLPAMAIAVAGGITVGILLPPVAMIMLRMHQGFSLYNIGLTGGFIAIFGAAVLTASGRALNTSLVWNSAPSGLLIYLVPLTSAVLLIFGLLGNARQNLRDFIKILTLPGRLPSDFMSSTSIRGSLINMGIIGLLTWSYVLLVGGDVNGPVLGGIFTALGFAAFGKHPKNSWPLVVGVVAACLVFGKDLAAPGPLLAALFCLTLAPVAGEFGWMAGVIAGFLHLVMVERTGAWHLGINLYNNGFAGGLTATLMVAVIEWFRTSRENSRTEPSYRRRR